MVSDGEVDSSSSSVPDQDIDMEQVNNTLQRNFVLDEDSGRFCQRLTCLVCKKYFKRLCNAVSHVRIHFNARPYKCKYCGVRFTQKGNRETHVQKKVC